MASLQIVVSCIYRNTCLARLQESWLNADMSNFAISIDGFDCFP